MEKSETNSKTPSPYARPGNRNATGKHRSGAGAPIRNKRAIGNRGGPGAPIRNKRALRTGEYETVFFDVAGMVKKDRTLQGVDYNKYVLAHRASVGGMAGIAQGGRAHHHHHGRTRPPPCRCKVLLAKKRSCGWRGRKIWLGSEIF